MHNGVAKRLELVYIGQILVQKSTNVSCWVLAMMLKMILFKTFSAGTVSKRQNLTSVDVRFRRLETFPGLKELQYFLWP